MNEIWIAIVSDIDDGGLIVHGIFDNEASAKECVEDDILAARSLVYKINPADVKSTYVPFDDD